MMGHPLLKPQYKAFHKLNNWINWKEVPASPKPRKIPCDATGAPINPHDQSKWVDIHTAIATGLNVGFVFGVECEMWFFDLDNCLGEDGKWTPKTLDFVAMFPGALVQVSNSGKGLHIFGSGQVPPHACKNVQLGLEFYTSDRFCAMTGNCNDGDPTIDFSATLPTFVEKYFPQSKADTTSSEWSSAPVPEWRGHTVDGDLIAHACRAKSMSSKLTGKATFQDLWIADPIPLAQTWSSDTGDEYDRSSADQSLACHLAFWTGKDCTRMERLMRQSGLVREKWDKHKTYMRDTILNACSMTSDVCQLPKADIETPAVRGEITQRVGHQYMDETQQQTYFKGMTYIADENRILCPNGKLLKEASFRAKYGGYCFKFDHNGKDSGDAWKVFTQSEVLSFPKADSTCFRPDLPFGTIVNDRVNIYLDPQVKLNDMDPEPFLRHLRLQFPNERDRTIFLSYLASCVQYKGVKFQWCPLIQGCEGNGKSLRKGMDQVTTDICANFILNSNHKDALRKHENDRRFAMFYTAQQCAEDLIRDGMDGNYFIDLYNWLRNGGYGAVAKYLSTYPISDEFNPATSCTRVPRTSSTAEAVIMGMGAVEHEILEMVEEGRTGFCAGWISLTHLKRAFERKRISARKLSEIVENLGYEPHPHLTNGRANNPILMDESVRSKLYIKKGSLLANITSGAEIVNRYVSDQQGVRDEAVRTRLGT